MVRLRMGDTEREEGLVMIKSILVFSMELLVYLYFESGINFCEWEKMGLKVSKSLQFWILAFSLIIMPFLFIQISHFMHSDYFVVNQW